MIRIVIGNYAGIVGMGMEAMLADCECEIVAKEPNGDLLADVVAASHPQVVLVDEDYADGVRLAAALSKRFPSVTVVAVSSSRPQLRVFPSHRAGRPYVRALDAAALGHVINDN